MDSSSPLPIAYAHEGIEAPRHISSKISVRSVPHRSNKDAPPYPRPLRESSTQKPYYGKRSTRAGRLLLGRNHLGYTQAIAISSQLTVFSRRIQRLLVFFESKRLDCARAMP